MKPNTKGGVLGALALAGLFAALPAAGFNAEDFEEAGGGTLSVLLNPPDTIYGVSIDNGVWLKKTPLFAQYSLLAFWSGKEDAWYSGFGVTLRLMPHFAFAPYVGGGGSYNLAMLHGDDEDDPDMPGRGDSFWAGHAEAGLRLKLPGKWGFLELSGRYVWPALEGSHHEYWLGIISLGQGF